MTFLYTENRQDCSRCLAGDVYQSGPGQALCAEHYRNATGIWYVGGTCPVADYRNLVHVAPPDGGLLTTVYGHRLVDLPFRESYCEACRGVFYP